MDVRTKTLFSCSLVVAALTTAGCSISQQSRAHLRQFVPAGSLAGGRPVLVDVPPSTSLLAERPAVPNLLAAPAVLPRWTAGDSKVQMAERSFEAARKLYQAEDFTGARRVFDEAIDQMIEASELEPADREDFLRRFEGMVETIHRLDVAGTSANPNGEDGRYEKAPLEDILQLTFPVDPKLKNRVREQVAATVSQLPLTVNDTILGYINFFSNRGRGTIIAATQRSGRYRQMIQRVLDEEGVPREMIHLAQAESGFMPRAMSRMAAGGMWQFISQRGQEYGLAKNRNLDERMDPEKATRAAARHLHDLYNQFGDWYLAIAAYNCGPMVVESAVERTGFADYWELRNRGVLPAETTNYVPIILAMTIIEKNAAEYGMNNIPMDPPLEYDTVDLTVPTNLALVSDLTETPMPQLTELNPAVLCGIAPQGYALHVPKGTGAQLSSGLEAIPPEHRGAWRVHQVESGETLAAIGKRFGVAPANIVAANSLNAPDAPAGDRLLIPAAIRAEAPARRPATATATRRTPTPQKRTVATTASPAAKPGTQAPRPPLRPAAASAAPAAKTAPKPVASSYRPGPTPAAPPAVMLAHSAGK
jgi:membrane-bound lytic murein transglycosylase D